MRPGERYPPGGPELADTQEAAPPANDLGRRAGQVDRGMRPAARRWRPAAAWTGGGLALFAFFLRISLGARVNSDGANNALQARDILHGHVLLHVRRRAHTAHFLLGAWIRNVDFWVDVRY
jgi:hypothetical protein